MCANTHQETLKEEKNNFYQSLGDVYVCGMCARNVNVIGYIRKSTFKFVWITQCTTDER